MTTPRGRIAPLALALVAGLALSACSHHDARQDQARRTADLMVAVVHTQLDIIKGLQTRLQPKPACAAAQTSVVTFVDAQGKALKPKTEALKRLLAHLGPEDTSRAVALARPQMGKIFSEGNALAGPEGKIASDFARRCPDAARAILAANAKVLALIKSVEQQVAAQ